MQYWNIPGQLNPVNTLFDIVGHGKRRLTQGRMLKSKGDEFLDPLKWRRSMWPSEPFRNDDSNPSVRIAGVPMPLF
jgi:hypothetical protein